MTKPPRGRRRHAVRPPFDLLLVPGRLTDQPGSTSHRWAGWPLGSPVACAAHAAHPAGVALLPTDPAASSGDGLPVLAPFTAPHRRPAGASIGGIRPRLPPGLPIPLQWAGGSS